MSAPIETPPPNATRTDLKVWVRTESQLLADYVRNEDWRKVKESSAAISEVSRRLTFPPKT